MQSALLSKDQVNTSGVISLFPEAQLARARLHEACGPARHRFALWLAARSTGPVLWIAPGWAEARIAPAGFAHMVDPGRLIFVDANRPDDILWCMEEALRSGAAAMTVADLPGLPGLTPVRRMHLAAETGAREGAGQKPLGLLLTPGMGGAQGIETRWHIAPDHAVKNGQWRLRRIRARMSPPAEWSLVHQRGAPVPQPVKGRTNRLQENVT